MNQFNLNNLMEMAKKCSNFYMELMSEEDNDNPHFSNIDLSKFSVLGVIREAHDAPMMTCISHCLFLKSVMLVDSRIDRPTE